jgi:hypothetical protein
MKAIAVPPEARLRALLPGCSFADAYRVPAPAAPPSLRELARSVLASPPVWAGWLMALRNAIARRLGLKTGAAAADLRGGGRIGMFPVLAESPGEMLLGLDDSHLDFRIAVSLQGQEPGARLLTVTTLVRTNNRLGRAYLACILPFHRFIVRGMLNRAARSWPG